MGVDIAATGNRADQISSPVSVWNMRNTCSAAAPMTKSPDPVSIAPPKFGTPHLKFGTIAGARFLIVPRGFCQTILPLPKSTATSLPHGGLVQGRFKGERKIRRAMEYGVPRCLAICHPFKSPDSLSRANFALGISLTKAGTSLTLVTAICRSGSIATPPQFEPPA